MSVRVLLVSVPLLLGCRDRATSTSAAAPTPAAASVPRMPSVRLQLDGAPERHLVVSATVAAQGTSLWTVAPQARALPQLLARGSGGRSLELDLAEGPYRDHDLRLYLDRGETVLGVFRAGAVRPAATLYGVTDIALQQPPPAVTIEVEVAGEVRRVSIDELPAPASSGGQGSGKGDGTGDGAAGRRRARGWRLVDVLAAADVTMAADVEVVAGNGRHLVTAAQLVDDGVPTTVKLNQRGELTVGRWRADGTELERWRAVTRLVVRPAAGPLD